MAKVTLLHLDGEPTPYTNYYDAAQAAASGELIQIWAHLNEQIVLKNGVDIWIQDGVIIDFNPELPTDPGPTITDNNDPVNCKIYGNGIIKNTYNLGSNYECISVRNPGTQLSVQCESLEGIGGTSAGSVVGATINVNRATKFHLKCNRVYSQRNCAIIIGQKVSSSVFYIIGDLNIQVKEVITGDSTYGTTAMVVFANGFITIDKIICKNLGHCLSVRGGNILAQIRSMSSTMSRSLYVATFHVDQGDNNQKIVLYFDEILSLSGSNSANVGIELHQGVSNIIGRLVSTNSYAIGMDPPAAAIQLSKSAQTPNGLPQGNLRIINILSENGTTLVLNDFTEKSIINSSNIQGNVSGDGGVIFSFDEANFELKNATIRNLETVTSGKALGLFKNTGNGHIPNVTLNNIKMISNAAIIYYNTGSPDINIKNYGLIGNKDVASNVTLEIGTNTNDVFIYSNDLT